MIDTPAVGGGFLIEPVGNREVFTDADFGESDLMYARTARDFVTKEVLPRLREIEEQQEGVMPSLLRRAGELGLLMLDIPEHYGGLGASKATSMLVSECAAKCGSFSVSWGAHTGIGTLPLVYYGTATQKERYLTKLAGGELLAAYALTEPEAGSDALAAKTTAVLTPDKTQYIVNGVKQFITNAGFADLFTVFAKVDGEQFTAFLVERSTPGVSTGPEEQKMGIKGSSTRQLILDNARVPAGNVLGEVGRGHKIAFNILNIGRLKLGCGAVGVAKECLTAAVQYAAERKQFGQPIASYGMIQRKIADMAVLLLARDRNCYRCRYWYSWAAWCAARLVAEHNRHARRPQERRSPGGTTLNPAPEINENRRSSCARSRWVTLPFCDCFPTQFQTTCVRAAPLPAAASSAGRASRCPAST